MNSIDHKIAEILGCEVKNIGNVLDNPVERTRVVSVLDKCKLVTLYKNRSGKREIVFGGISFKSARDQYAYQKFKRTSVYQHFYVRHRILLEYPDNPCLKYIRKNGHIDYYPLELVGLKGISPFLHGKKLNEGIAELCSTKLAEGYAITEHPDHIILDKKYFAIVLDKNAKKPFFPIKKDFEIGEFIRKGEQEFNDLPTPTSSASSEARERDNSENSRDSETWSDSSANETTSDSDFEGFYENSSTF